MQRFVNPFEIKGRWYKANLHTHSTTSDGPLTPAERVEQYQKGGYSVLALTDHWRTNDLRGLGDGKKMLVVGGMEYHPPCHDPPGGWWHLVALGVPHGFELYEDVPANRCIAKVRQAGGENILAHPAWCGQAFVDFEHLKDVIAIEVYNSGCDPAGRPSSENEWSVALDRGWKLPAVAVDDCHGAYELDVLESWTWLKMPSLSTANVIKAVKTGACYASCGPRIHDFRIDGHAIRLRCSPAAKIQFVSTPGRGGRRRAAEGKTITTFNLKIPKLRNWPWQYVRAVVTDTHGRKAWANPLYPK